MIVLDTNVISELMRPEPDAGVLAWVAGQPRAMLYATSISQAEILSGIAMLPEGRRRTALGAAAEAIFAEDLAGRILPFDSAACIHYARIVSKRRAAGSPIDAFDAMIAATTLAAGASVATRDTNGFEGCGVAVIDPWKVSRLERDMGR